MPRATVDNTPVHKDLKSAPPDGFVDIVALPYGKMLHRRENATRMSMEQQQGKRDPQEKQKVDFEMIQRETRMYEFANCIINHNLEDHLGRKLDFTIPRDFDSLAPKVGAEIEKYIDELNQEEDDDDIEDFTKPASSSSKKEIEKSIQA